MKTKEGTEKLGNERARKQRSEGTEECGDKREWTEESRDGSVRGQKSQEKKK